MAILNSGHVLREMGRRAEAIAVLKPIVDACTAGSY
jgi:hypothetical protein